MNVGREDCEDQWKDAVDTLITKAEEDYDFEEEDEEMEKEENLCMEHYEDDSGCLCSCATLVQGCDSDEEENEDSEVMKILQMKWNRKAAPRTSSLKMTLTSRTAKTMMACWTI